MNKTYRNIIVGVLVAGLILGGLGLFLKYGVFQGMMTSKQARTSTQCLTQERIFDEANVLTDAQEESLFELLSEKEQMTGMDIVLLTIREHFGYLKGLKVAYLGDGRNNVANSLLIGSVKMGLDVTICGPKTLWPNPELVELCKGYAEESGSTIEITDDLDGVKGADVLYTDVWISMGEEKKEQERERIAKPYQINKELMARTGKPGTIFSHCLPAVKGKEVTEDVFESEASLVFEEAENRLHTIKAIMVATLGETEE